MTDKAQPTKGIWILETWFPSFTEGASHREYKIVPEELLENIKRDLSYNQALRFYVPSEDA
jgi:hypothetical protein